MNKLQLNIIENVFKLVGFVLLFINSYTAQAQKPVCNFGDTSGYFYHWEFDGDNPTFTFELTNSTASDIRDKITNYEIKWGDEETTNITNDKFPYEHEYTEERTFTLIITITYNEKQYDYTYKVYNSRPSLSLEKISGDNGCVGQEFVFKITEYEQNPPSTLYKWDFEDDTENIIWSKDELEENDGIISHTYKKSSCTSENNGKSFYPGAEPIIITTKHELTGVGVKLGGFAISKDIDINLALKVNEKKEDIEDEHTGCVDNTFFNFTNSSDYGLNGSLCRKSGDHKWEIFKLSDDGSDRTSADPDTDYIFTLGDIYSEEDVSIKFLKKGEYIIRFSLSNSCRDLTEETGTISIFNNESTTEYTPHNFCLAEKKTVSFTTDEYPEIEALQKTIYLWSSSATSYTFEEETKEDSKDPKIKFNEAGKHIIYLLKESYCGTENYEYIVDVSDVPIVSINELSDLTDGGHCGTFTFSPTANFIDNGEETFKIEGNVIDEYEWTFNNNGTITSSSDETPGEITFSKVGKSSISLKTHNNCGWSTVDKIEFEIYEIPTAKITSVNQACEDIEIDYAALPNDMNTYTWAFGDGHTGSGQNTTKTFTNAGTYTNKLTVTSTDGCSNSTEKTIDIIAKPTINIGEDMTICSNDDSFIISDVSAEDYDTIEWTITTGDGTLSKETTTHPTYTLGATDPKNLKIELSLTAKGNGTCNPVSAIKTINVTPAPNINIASPTATICENESLEVTGITISNAESILWSSDEDGGSFSSTTTEMPSYMPKEGFNGTIHLTVTAIANTSCDDITGEIELKVNALPIVEAGEAASICEDQTVELSGTSTGTTNIWSILGDGNGTFDNDENLSTTYTPGTTDIENGSVVLQLTAEADTYCSAVSDTRTITIQKNATAEAGDDFSLCKTEDSYTIISGYEDGQANANYYSSIKWTHDGTGRFVDATIINATYEPSKADLDKGSVKLTLVANPLNHCSDITSDFMILSFIDPPEANAGDDMTKCQGSSVDLSGVIDVNSTTLWTSRDGKGHFDDDTKVDAQYISGPDETGSITLTLTAIPSSSCEAVSDDLILTLIGKVTAEAGGDSGGKGEVCSNGEYNLSSGETGASVYSASTVKWTKDADADGNFDDDTKINAIYTPGTNDIAKGSVTLTLTAQPEAPCHEEATDDITLTITPAPMVNAGRDQAICQGNKLDLTYDARATNYSFLKWTSSSETGFFENGTFNPKTDDTDKYATYHPGKDDTGKYTLTLTADGNDSCESTSNELELNITPAPIVTIEDIASICEDGNTVIKASVSNDDGYTWETNGKGTLSNTDGLTPTYQTAEGEVGDITISLTAKGNTYCNYITKSTTLSIIPHPTIAAVDEDEICSDATYELQIGSEEGQINAESYSSIEYITSGDGLFKLDGLDATYAPGETDKSKKEVDITIRANAINPPCDNYAEHVIKLEITPAPIVKAGIDDKICQGDTYQLLKASEQNTSELTWSNSISDGGSFDNASILQPTYAPKADKTGIVQLTLTGEGDGSCNSTYDIMSLEIVAIPKVSAGDNASICFGKTYDLNTTFASSSSTNNWTTDGTGSFIEPTDLHTTYIPSDEDYKSGKVKLTITVQGLTPCLMDATDALTLSFVKAPFISAGNDDEICEENGKYTIKAKTTENPTGSEAKDVSSYKWETDGEGSLQNSNTLTPTYIPAEHETGTIQLILTAVGFSNCGNIEDTMELTIIPTPETDFSIGTSCIGSLVSFEDESTNGSYSIEEWSWDFGDGNISNEQNPSHEFSEIKNYTVTLSVINNKGCTSKISKTVNIHPLPEVKFIHDNFAAINIPTILKNESLNAISYFWDFGDGHTSTEIEPQHTYTNKGFYTIELTAESKDGCSNTQTSEIEIIGKPEARFSKTADGCGPLSVEFTNLSTGKFMTYLWDFGNGIQSTQANPDPVIFEQGVLSDTTYYISLTLENKAGTSIFKDKVIVKPFPIPLFEILPTSYGCSPVVRELFNHSKGLPNNYSFDFGDGESYEYDAKDVERPFEHTFTTGDTKTIYPITLTASNECGNRSITKNMTVFPNTAVAVMKVEDAEGCAPFTVEFQNLSTGAGDYLESDWTFEDGEMAIRDYEGKTVYHTFEKAGVYQVQLNVHDTCATDLTTREIIVNDAIDIDFEIKARKFCMFEEVQLSIPEDISNQFTNFIWDLGDGTVIKESNINHFYNKAGNYLIKLSAISKENSCEKTQIKELIIHQKPIADFNLSSNEGCEPFQVSFINNSSFADYYQWDFNDSSKSSAKNPTHPFSKGNYTVSLIAESVEGCLDTLSADLISRPKPDAQFEMDINKSCLIPTTIKIQNTSTDKEFNGYVWDFDNGTIRTDKQAIEETFTSEGEYNIKLIAENQFHCTDTFTQQLNVYTAPVAEYKITSKTTCQDELIEFEDASSNSLYCYWSFSDGASAEGKNASHIFKDYGKYDLKLKVIGDGNCADSLFAKESILIYPKPNVNFSWENINTPPDGVNIPDGVSPPNNGLIQFTNLTEVLDKDWIKDNKYTYQWDFDDLQLSQEKDPLHKYNNNGTFQVKLTALSAYSCQNIISESVEVDLMSSLFVPNAFNPGNPNPEVAIFLPKGIGLHTYNIEILDLWGKVVWFSNEIKDGRPAKGWDGNMNGKPLPQGVYVWKIRAVFNNGATWQGMKIDGKYHREGSITLIK